MVTFTRIDKVDLVGPTALSVFLADDNGTRVGPVVICPNNFITDFSTFLTALRAAGATQTVAHDLLEASWEETRQLLRKRLIEEDPWGRHAVPPTTDADEPPEYWSMVLCMGEEGAQRLLKERRERQKQDA